MKQYIFLTFIFFAGISFAQEFKIFAKDSLSGKPVSLLFQINTRDDSCVAVVNSNERGTTYVRTLPPGKYVLKGYVAKNNKILSDTAHIVTDYNKTLKISLKFKSKIINVTCYSESNAKEQFITLGRGPSEVKIKPYGADVERPLFEDIFVSGDVYSRSDLVHMVH